RASWRSFASWSRSIDCAVSSALEQRLHEQPFSNADGAASGCDSTHIGGAVQLMLPNCAAPEGNQDADVNPHIQPFRSRSCLLLRPSREPVSSLRLSASLPTA